MLRRLCPIEAVDYHRGLVFRDEAGFDESLWFPNINNSSSFRFPAIQHRGCLVTCFSITLSLSVAINLHLAVQGSAITRGFVLNEHGFFARQTQLFSFKI